MNKKGDKFGLENILYVICGSSILLYIISEVQLFINLSLILLFITNIISRENIKHNYSLIKRVIVVVANKLKMSVRHIEEDVVTAKRPNRRKR
jgi:hypothetical protein